MNTTIPTASALVWFITEKRAVVNSVAYKEAVHGRICWWVREGDAAWTRVK